MILFDFTFHAQPFDLVDKIISSSPKSAVIAILWESKNIDLDRVVLSGARAFVKFPFQEGKLTATIKRVLQLMDRHRSQTVQAAEPVQEDVDCHMFTVFSPKGGAGTTTVATNLAISLHNTLGEEVLLIDGKLMFGHIALYLNLLTGNSITDLLTYAEMLDDQIIKQVVVQHTSGIHVLLSPHSINEAQGIKPKNLFEVIQSLQRMYPNIVVDGGHNLNENSVTFMDASDKILLVVNPELSSMRDVNQFMEISSSLSYPKEKISLILNLIKRKTDVKTEEVERVLNMEIFGKIPADEKLAVESINEGVPIIMKNPHHPISKAYKRIAKDLVAQMKVVEDEESESEADA
ncbi:MAG: AAA family ATPase [Chloroflexota bacterium]|nr:AAA family ATPase [Chloroflexota bacterium]